MVKVPAESNLSFMSLVPKSRDWVLLRPNAPDVTLTPVMGTIFQNFLTDCEHPELGLPASIDTPVESVPENDIISPWQILGSGLFVNRAFVPALI